MGDIQKSRKGGRNFLGALLFAVVGGVSLFAFQNCGVPSVETLGSESPLASIGGDPTLRLPPGGGVDSPSQAPTSCSANAPAVIPARSAGLVIVSSSQPLSGIVSAVAYGNKNGQRDGSEVFPLVYPAAPQANGTVHITVPNPDFGEGGRYQRIFELRDGLGRAICQTGVVQYTFEGIDCSLRTDRLTYRSAEVVGMFASYTQGSAIVPMNGSIRFEGFDLIANNLIAIAPEVPPGHSPGTPSILAGSSLTDWYVNLNSNVANRDRIRRIVVRDADQGVICRSNYVRYTVTN